jgi:hypothetical protein
MAYSWTSEFPQVHSSERHRCRNPHCRVKLPAPVENEHRAFCTRGCYESFYWSRCRVCERDLRKNGKRGDASRLYCRPPADCRREAEKWPEKYGGGVWAGFPETKLRNAHLTGIKSALGGDLGSPAHRSLRGWGWGSDLSLYDENGFTVARLVHEGDGRYCLRAPVTWPQMAWSGLAQAKHHAEALALCNLPLNFRTAVRIRRGNNQHPTLPGNALNGGGS